MGYEKSFKDEEGDAEYMLDRMVEAELMAQICETCNFPIDPDNATGIGCVCTGEE